MQIYIKRFEGLVKILAEQLNTRVLKKRYGAQQAGDPTGPMSSLTLRGKIDDKAYFLLRAKDPDNPVTDVPYKEIP